MVIMALEIYLIRHGESEVNVDFKHIISGRSNWTELTNNGIVQARTLGNRLRKEGLEFDVIYTSPAIRTQQTARYCLEVMDKSIHDVNLEYDIIELTHGDWEGKLKKEIYSRQEVREGLDQDNWNYVPGDKIKGESQAMVAKRMKGWLERIVEKHTSSKVLVFSHGLAIKYLLTDLFNLDKPTAYKMPIDNTSISMIKFDCGEFTYITRNDSSHLKEAGLTKVSASFDDSKKDV